MKPSLKGTGGYDYVYMFLREATTEAKGDNEIYTGSYKNVNKSRIGTSRIHQLLALTDHQFNKSTKVPSRACSKCNKEVVYCMKQQPDGKSFENPFCSILGRTLCKNCSILFSRQHMISDTKRVLEKFSEPEGKRNIKEQALLNRINYRDKERLYQNDCGYLHGKHNVLPPGSIARNNTPDSRYLNTRQRNRERNKTFCQKPLRRTLKGLSLMIEDIGDFQNIHIDDSIGTIREMTIDSPSRLSEEISLPDLKNLKFQNNISQTFTVLDKLNNAKFDKSHNYHMDYPAESRLDTEELNQKISILFEQRYLPPLNRSHSTSTVSSIGSTEDNDLKSPEQLSNSERNVHEQVTCKDSSTVVPLLMNVKLQKSRQKMFSDVEDLLPNIANNINASHQGHIPLLRIRKHLKKEKR